MGSRDRLHATMLGLLQDRVPKGRVLDVGCGDGTLARKLRGPTYTVHCCDFAGVHGEREGLAHALADLRSGLPYATGSVNGIVCSEVLEHLLDPATAINELSRVLAPGGTLVLSLPNYWNLHHRFRYLTSGALQRCYCKNVPLTGKHEDVCLPHVNAATFETYSFVLRRAGLEVQEVRGTNRWAFFRALPYLPIALFVRLLGFFRRSERVGGHSGVNAWSTLLGRHVCIVCKRA